MSRAVCLLTLLFVACAAPSGPPESSSLFPLGVASADPATDSVLLWTRYDGTRPLRYQLWPRGAEGIEVSSQGAVTVSEGGFVQLPLAGLASGAEYSYAFVEDGVAPGQSRIGHFRTAPAAGARPVIRLAVFSCAKNGRPMGILEHAADEEVDAALYLGDSVYADAAHTLAEYRAKWTENLSTLGFRAMRASTATIATWDDHEVLNDWSGDSVAAERRAIAEQAFFEHMPLRRDETLDPPRIWRSVRFGDTAEVFVLDSRSERDPASREGPDARYLSVEQFDWLKQSLSASTAVFKVVMTSVPISDFPSVFDAAAGDRWEGYPAQRTALLDWIETEQLKGVLFVAGDFHLGASTTVAPTGPAAKLRELVVGPVSNFTNAFVGALGAPQFDWAAAVDNYATLTLDPAADEVTVTFRGADGRKLFDKSYAAN